MKELLVFTAQFFMVFLLGLQSLNVNRGHYMSAATTSLALGVCGFYITATIAAVHGEGMGTWLWWSYIAAGPMGIVASMWAHPIIRRVFDGKD